MRIVAQILFFSLFFIRRLHIMDEFSSRRQSSDCRQEHICFIKRLQVMVFFRVFIKEAIMRLHVIMQVMDLFSVLIKETINGLWYRLWTSSAFSSRRLSWDFRLWTSSEFSWRVHSFDRPMRGSDLIMWSEGQWKALKKIKGVHTHGNCD